MDNSAIERSVGKRGGELAGRLLDALCTLDPTTFAFLPGKLSGDLLPPNPTPSKTECNSFVTGVGFSLPTVGNGVVVGNGVEEVENGVEKLVAEHDDESTQTGCMGRRGGVGMHLKPSEGQSTINEKNFKNG